MSSATVLVILIALAMSLSLPNAVAVPSYVVYDNNTNSWIVSPTGGDDTQNIQRAFDEAVMAGPGSTVQLTAGQFYCNNIVVKGFQGTFKGAGKGVTKIDTLRALDPKAPPLSAPVDYPALLQFVGGSLRISDMTFEITPFRTTETYRYPGLNQKFCIIDTIVRIDGRYVDSQVERVQFIGHKGAGYYNPGLIPDNCHTGMRIADLYDFEGTFYPFHVGPTTGTHTVKGCEFSRFTEGLQALGLSNGRLLVGGSPMDANTFTDCFSSVMTRNIEGSVVEISYNYMDGTRGSQIFCYNDMKPQEKPTSFGPITSPSQVLISHNTMICNGDWADAIYLDDDGPSIGNWFSMEFAWSLRAVVSNNKIVLNTPVGGIYGFGIEGAVISGNEISGTGLAGVYPAPGPYGSFGWMETCSNWTLVGNNYEHLDAGVSQVWLGPWSDHCTVVGGSKDTVLDQGTDNLLVGINNMGSGISVGDNVSDAMEKKHDLMKLMW